MIKKKILVAMAVVLASVMVISTGVNASAIKGINDGKNICDEITIDDPNYDVYCKKRGETQGKNVVAEILKVVFLWLGIIATVVVIIGGVLYMLAQGDTNKVQRAKQTIIYAMVGMVVSLLAFAIVSFVVQAYDSGTVKGSNSSTTESEDKSKEDDKDKR